MADEERNQQRVTDVKVTVGSEVDKDHLHSFVVTQDLGQPDMAVITIRNEGHTFSNDANHGDAVEVKVNDQVIFKGEVVGLEPEYKVGGESKVRVRAFNKLHRLGRGRKSRTFLEQKDSDIVGTVAGDHGLSPDAEDSKITHAHVYQHNQTDLEFLRVRAARLGFDVWVDDQTLHFSKPKHDVDSGISLDMGEPNPDETSTQLKAFLPRLSSASMVKKVTVRGWTPEKKEEIVGEVEASSSKLGKTGGESASSSAFGDTATFEVDFPIFSVDEAKAIAESKLDDLLMSYITGEGDCVGFHGLKPGVVVKVVVNPDRTDDRFNGKYMLVGCTHKFTFSKGGGEGGGGSTTSIRFHRNAEGGQ